MDSLKKRSRRSSRQIFEETVITVFQFDEKKWTAYVQETQQAPRQEMWKQLFQGISQTTQKLWRKRKS